MLAADVVMPWDLPGWDNSAMDGFAVRSADCTGPVTLRVTGYIPAGGLPAGPVGPGEATRIMTGAPLPPGADAIAPVEDVEEAGDAIQLRGAVRPGAHVRRRGEDLRAGEVALTAGHGGGAGRGERAGLGRPALRCRWSVGRASPSCRRATSWSRPASPSGPGQVCDSNGVALAAAVRLAGGEPIDLGIARDDRPALRALLERGLAADVLRHLRRRLRRGSRPGAGDPGRAPVRQVFWKVDIKPGRPTAFGVRGRTPVFSLPGNPVSSLLTFEQFVRPALLRMMGHRRVFRPLRPRPAAGAARQVARARQPRAGAPLAPRRRRAARLDRRQPGDRHPEDPAPRRRPRHHPGRAGEPGGRARRCRSSSSGPTSSRRAEVAERQARAALSLPRAVGIALRTAHLGTMAVLAGGAWYGVPAGELRGAAVATALSGLALLVSEASHSRHWIYQGRGLLVLAHVGVAGLVSAWGPAALMGALVVGAVGSHLPKCRYNAQPCRLRPGGR